MVQKPLQGCAKWSGWNEWEVVRGAIEMQDWAWDMYTFGFILTLFCGQIFEAIIVIKGNRWLVDIWLDAAVCNPFRSRRTLITVNRSDKLTLFQEVCAGTHKSFWEPSLDWISLRVSYYQAVVPNAQEKRGRDRKQQNLRLADRFEGSWSLNREPCTWTRPGLEHNGENFTAF